MCLARLLSFFVGGVLVLGAVAKAVDPFSVFPALDALLIPPDMRAVAVLGLIAVEGWLGLALCLGLATRATRAATIILFGILTAILGILAMHPDRPACGCFGALESGVRFAAWPITGIGRNICLIGCLVWNHKGQPL